MGGGLVRRCAGALALAGLAACAADPPRPADPATLTVADRAFARAVTERGLEAWVGAFAEDGVMLTREGVVGPGLSTIRAYMAPAFADTGFRLAWEPAFARVAASDDVGYTVGAYRSRRGGGHGAPVMHEGRYVTVWRKGSDGTWRVALATLPASDVR